MTVVYRDLETDRAYLLDLLETVRFDSQRRDFKACAAGISELLAFTTARDVEVPRRAWLDTLHQMLDIIDLIGRDISSVTLLEE